MHAAMPLRPAAGFCLETPMRNLVDFECDVRTHPYVTVIHHDREQRTFVNDAESVVSGILQYAPYPTGMGDISEFIDLWELWKILDK